MGFEESPGGSPRFIDIHEVEPPKPKAKLPVPIRPIRADEWNPGKAAQVWDRMSGHEWMLPDEAKGEMRDLFKATLAGKVYWFELGDENGLAHVWDVNNGAAKANFEWVGRTRGFVKKYGPVEDCKRIWLKALFKWLKLRRLTVEVAATNAPARRFLTRMGFKQEGVLREAWVVKGKPEDVLGYGVLASEVA